MLPLASVFPEKEYRVPPPVERSVMPIVWVVLLAKGWAMPCHITCTTSAGVTEGVLVGVGVIVKVGVIVGVRVGVLVGGHGSGRDVVAFARIIQLPGIVLFRSSM